MITVVGLRTLFFMEYVKVTNQISKVLVLVLGLILSACAKNLPAEYSVDPVFEPYLEKYITEAAKRGVVVNRTGFADGWKFKIAFGDLPSRVLGQCARAVGTDQSNFQNTSFEYREITIDRDSWDREYEYNKIDVLLHEISHCAAGRGHDDTNTTFTIGDHSYIAPKSIMNTYSVSFRSIGHFAKFENYYLDELFGVNSSSSIATGSLASTTPTLEETVVNNESESCYFKRVTQEDGSDIGYHVCDLMAR